MKNTILLYHISSSANMTLSGDSIPLGMLNKHRLGALLTRIIATYRLCYSSAMLLLVELKFRIRLYYAKRNSIYKETYFHN